MHLSFATDHLNLPLRNMHGCTFFSDADAVNCVWRFFFFKRRHNLIFTTCFNTFRSETVTKWVMWQSCGWNQRLWKWTGRLVLTGTVKDGAMNHQHRHHRVELSNTQRHANRRFFLFQRTSVLSLRRSRRLAWCCVFNQLEISKTAIDNTLM